MSDARLPIGARLDIHHIVPRSERICHDPPNLTLRCGACHRAIHDGRLQVTGTAPDQLTTRTTDPGVVHESVRAELDPSAELTLTDRADAIAPISPASASPLAPSPLPPTPPSKWEAVATRTDAIAGLKRMGFHIAVATKAVDAALRERGPLPIERLLFEALRRCPTPETSTHVR